MIWFFKDGKCVFMGTNERCLVIGLITIIIIQLRLKIKLFYKNFVENTTRNTLNVVRKPYMRNSDSYERNAPLNERPNQSIQSKIHIYSTAIGSWNILHEQSSLILLVSFCLIGKLEKKINLEKISMFEKKFILFLISSLIKTC